jgi:23S rRNA (uracil1939-C5)-methyltransferase
MSNDIKVTISHIGAKGDGVADVDGVPLYVPLSAAGDELDVNIDGQSARIKRIITPGPERVAPACIHYGPCGGCALQHISPGAYALWKRGLVIEALGHRGFTDAAVGDLIISPPLSRRRARFHVLSKGKGGVHIGFHERSSNRIVDLQDCKILTPEIHEFLPKLRGVLRGILPEGHKASVQVSETESGLDVWVETLRRLDMRLRMTIADFVAEADLARMAWGPDKEIVAERRAPHVRFGGIPVVLPPGAFLQPTLMGEQTLVELALKALKGAKRVADLFAGCGTFTLALARCAHVHAVEGEGEMTAALKRAVDMTSQNMVTVEKRDLFRRPLQVAELNAYDGVLFDPPRVGASAQAEELAKSKVKVIVAVSCNPATFARDARALVNGGYVMEHVTPVDQFLWTAHVELVAVFRKA